ncbi:starch phosphorylase [Syntrophus gentianae]|uniref:Starch phosphorylase n=1 Tax=Syntrophus gentianae TaxID=43775 RepID=A0A1H8ANT0_9BACT|nr:alpha-glucan family phosphorylase [Syntrophus gentianae]SEM71478.1 starch phosphorylase [Syntrophus gentianae]
MKEMKVKDPVCGMNGWEELSYEYAGHLFYFCSTFCRDKFIDFPDLYLNHLPITKKLCLNGERNIAYFSMEIGIEPSIPTYSGGLGVLAGDTIRSCADLKVPMVAVTLLHHKGYFVQKLDAKGNQQELPSDWIPSDWLEPLGLVVSVEIEQRTVWIQAWLYEVTGQTGYVVPVIFLDADLPENDQIDRTLTDYLYGGDERYRLAQEILLGIGGVRMLGKAGYNNIRKYHMNEGHSSLLTLELLNRNGMKRNGELDYDAVREACVFTTHTPVAVGHDKFSYELVGQVLGEIIPLGSLKMLAGDKHLNMTQLALNLSGHVNGVAKKHVETSQAMFPGYSIDSITNGIHALTWSCESFIRLYDRYIPAWRNDPQSLRSALSILAEEIWEAHMEAKKILIEYVNRTTSHVFEPGVFTIGFARRSTAYKRPDLILTDTERLAQIAKSIGSIQLVFAGKAHPKDEPGKDLIRRIFNLSNKIDQSVRITYLENYDMTLGGLITSGVDLWLNTPLAPNEASGTSGMKAAVNGVPSLSVLDGWWIEGCIEGLTGWSIGSASSAQSDEQSDEAQELYKKLEQILQIFYSCRKKWIRVMQHCIAINGSFFNTHRMIQQYVLNSYFCRNQKLTTL